MVFEPARSRVAQQIQIGPNRHMTCRIFLDTPLQPDTPVTIPEPLAHYLRQVMRLQKGDAVVVFDGRGGEYQGTIEQLARNDARCMVGRHEPVSRELDVNIHVIQAASRSEKIEHTLQKCTELGATSFTIVRSERSALKLEGKKLDERIQRWRKIIIEAAEQSGRTAIPEVEWATKTADITPHGRCMLLHPEAAHPWRNAREQLAEAREISIAIGPEGGWSRKEIDLLLSRGFEPLQFGPRTLRTETAAPALVAALQAIRD